MELHFRKIELVIVISIKMIILTILNLNFIIVKTSLYKHFREKKVKVNNLIFNKFNIDFYIKI